IGNDVFIGPNATFTNDKFPRSKKHQDIIPITMVEDGASIGANATVLPGITIGRQAMIAAGSVVTHSVPPRTIVVGNPARIEGYVDTSKRILSTNMPSPLDQEPNTISSKVRGVTIHCLKAVYDLRGNLSAGNFAEDIPFLPKRYFVVFDVPAKDVRGEHAHK